MKGISVIIPTYNRSTFIRQAIDSVINQDYEGPIELIISDDGSTDSTLSIASTYGSKVKIIERPANCITQGASGARNRGIVNATQHYISFLDSDDYLLPGHLKRMVNILENDHSKDFAFCRSLEFNDSNPDLFHPWTQKNITEREISNIVVSSIFIVNTNVFLFKREIFDHVGLFNENYRVGEDSDLWMRISERYKGVFSDHYGAAVRLHNSFQLTKIPKETLLKDYVTIFTSAIKRYHQLNLNDEYRLRKLKATVAKYKLSQLPILFSIYMYINQLNSRKRTNTTDWRPLSYYLSQ
jgi:glycosyltransferase involved in cell wall biosynthesis